MNSISMKSLVVLALGFSSLAAPAPSTQVTIEFDIADLDFFGQAQMSRVPTGVPSVQSDGTSLVVDIADVDVFGQPQMSKVPTGVPIVQSDGTFHVVDSGAKFATDDEEFDLELGPTADVQAYLSAHNSFRSKHGAGALAWDNNLAAKAQQWANRCVFKHSGGTLGPYGENLAAGTGDYGAAKGVKGWTDEAPQYNPRNPQPSHFTQVVWKSTQRVGCAVASCNGIFDPKFGKAQYHVCEYYPAGNVIGHFPENVQA